MDSEAAEWAARIDARPDEVLPELDLWLAADPRRSGALLRAQAILDALGAKAEQSSAPQSELRVPKPVARWFIIGGGSIAAIAAAVALFLAMPRPGVIYETGAGETWTCPGKVERHCLS